MRLVLYVAAASFTGRTAAAFYIRGESEERGSGRKSGRQSPVAIASDCVCSGFGVLSNHPSRRTAAPPSL